MFLFNFFVHDTINLMNDIYDLIIIGGGPAGLTAAIYARRANLNVLLIEEFQDGGKLSKISKIDNYPGFDSISGFELENNFLTQAKKYETKIINEKVISLKNNIVTLSSNTTYQGRTILIATGNKERKLNIPLANEFEGKGISYCATCDGFFFKNKEIVVIGNNEKALQETEYLCNIVSKITFITKNENIIGDKTIIEKLTNNNKIHFKYNFLPTKLLLEDNKICGLLIKNTINNNTETINCAGIFPFIDYNPSTDFVDEKIKNEKGYIVVKSDMSTSIDGIYAAGDCTQKDLKQVVTACSDGAIAATSIIKYLKNN